MKFFRNTMIICGAFSLSLTACSEKFNIDEPSHVNFSVRLEDPVRYDEATDTYIVRKDEPVSFSFEGGHVDNILFYSGELGYEYRYRHRTVADTDADITPKINFETSLVNPNSNVCTDFRLLSSNDLTEYTDDGVMSAEWKMAGKTDIRNGDKSTSVMSEYWSPVSGVQGTWPEDEDLEDWLSRDQVCYAISARSDEAEYNRLRLASFDVVNEERRDYSYVLDGVAVDAVKTRSNKIFSALSFYGDNYAVVNDATAACWALYIPEETTVTGVSGPVPNSGIYAWNAAEMGLDYGEGSGYPWVRTNCLGQAIRCTYAIEVVEPVDLPLADGSVIETPSDAMKKQPAESWIITRNHHPRQVDKDEASAYIKIKSMSMVWNFSYNFAEKGKYLATFVVNNQNRNETFEKTVEFNIIVID